MKEIQKTSLQERDVKITCIAIPATRCFLHILFRKLYANVVIQGTNIKHIDKFLVISHLRRGMSLRATKGSEAISSICAPHLEIASSLRSSQRQHPPKTEVLQFLIS
jgi:hypothetical protein